MGCVDILICILIRLFEVSLNTSHFQAQRCVRVSSQLLAPQILFAQKLLLVCKKIRTYKHPEFSLV